MNIYERMKHYRVNGLSIAVVDSGRLQWAKAYGLADAGSKETLTTETLFQTASIGKMITALAALHLVKEGKISLDEDVNQKLTSWRVPESKYTKKEKVTLRRLLNHSGGFTDYYGFAGYNLKDSLPSLLQILKAQPPANNSKALVVKYVPGKEAHYSGGGYLIIQQLIEDITGTSFPKYVEREIFQRLDLKSSTYNSHPDEINGYKIARSHYNDGRIDSNKKYNIYPEQAAAGFWSTPSDLARIVIKMQEEYNGRSEKILNRELMQLMLSTQLETSPRGLGVVLMGAKDVSGFWHSGQNTGYNSLLYATIKSGQGVVIMLNSDGGIELAQEITRSIANECKWPFMQTRLSKKEDLDSLKEHVGRYRSKEGLVIKVGHNKDGLIIQYKDRGNLRFGPPTHLYHLEQGGFIIKEVPDLLHFDFTSVAGKKAIVLHKNAGVKMVLEKQK
jgi:CubicO group peptidase (beta-lactamase class C family)